MAADVKLMVFPDIDRGMPHFLLEQHGVWRDMGIAPSLDALSTIQNRINSRFQELMGLFENDDLPAGDAAIWFPWFQELYEPLVPKLLRDELGVAARSGSPTDIPILRIYLHQALDWIPWEMMLDEANQLLGLQFQVARLPIMQTGPDFGNGQPYAVARIYSVLGENVLDTAQYAQWETTFTGLLTPAVSEHRLPDGTGSWPRTGDLRQTEDGHIIHFTCHGGFYDTEAGESYWTLNHLRNTPFHQIRPGGLRQWKLSARPLVFGNACSSAGGAGGDRRTLMAGLGPAFYAGRAAAFVGTFAPISKQTAVEFPPLFYQELLIKQRSLGEAVWAAKTHYATAKMIDPSPLFYCLYGLPETRFQLAQ